MLSFARRASFALSALLLWACQPAAVQPEPDTSIAPAEGPAIGLVMASAEAQPSAETRDGSMDSVVLASAAGDVAWIAAADRQFGLRIYALDGQEVSAFGVGRLNAVDAVRVADNEYVIAASNESALAVSLFRASIADGVLTMTALPPMSLALAEPHALCMELSTGQLRVYVADRAGKVEEWHIDARGFGSLVRAFTFQGQVQTCVVEPESRRLFAGERGVGIWSLDLDSGDRTMIDGIANQQMLPDAAGLAIHASAEGRYLVAASSYGHGVVVYGLPSGEPRAGFRVNPNAQLGLDGMPVTAGVSVFSEALPNYPHGILITHDGSGNHRRFKIVDWRAVMLLLES